ncbi:spore coat protein U domain-containing protein, partial [Burkholderia pseudomallei]
AVTLTQNVLVCLKLGGTSPRYLTNGSNQMQYDMYQDSGHTVSWGSSYFGTTPFSLTLVMPALSTSAIWTVSIFGLIAAN